MNGRRHPQEFALSFFGRDPADAADARGTGAPLEDSCRPSHAVIDNRHAVARDEPHPRLRHEPARGYHGSVRASQRFACYPSRHTGADVAVGMKYDRQAYPHHGGQHSRTIHVNQIGPNLFRQQPNPSCQARHPAEESQRIRRRFTTGAERSAFQSRRFKTQRTDSIEQRAIARHADDCVPAAFPYGG